MKKFYISISLLLFGTLISACSQTASTQYLHSRNGATLVVTPPLTKRFITNHFHLPAAKKVTQRPSILPPDLDKDV